MSNGTAFQTSWEKKRQARKRTVLIVAVLLVLAALVGLIVRNNLWVSPKSLAQRMTKKDTVQVKQGMEWWDGHQFRYNAAPDVPDSKPQKDQYLYSYKLAGCRASPADEKELELTIALDLQFNSALLLQEIADREDDLRIMVNLTVSSQNLDNIEVTSLRPAIKEKLNSLLRGKGQILDVRFIDFQIERKAK